MMCCRRSGDFGRRRFPFSVSGRQTLCLVWATMALGGLLPSASAWGQGQAPVDSITLRVLAAGSTPIRGAHVRLGAEHGDALETVTDSTGAGHFVVRNGSGLYELRVRAFGYIPLTIFVQRPAGRSQLDRTVVLNAQSVQLPTVKVDATPPRTTPVPGDVGSQWSALTSESLPIEPGKLQDVAALQPGVAVSLGGVSVAGQAPDQNRYSVDGATSSATSLPSEGIRSAGVITDSYDVSRGQYSGGEIAATTIAGTNRWGGAVSGSVTDPSLRYGVGPVTASNVPTQSRRLSAGGGGPIIHDRLFVYAAADLLDGRAQRSGSPLVSPAALSALGLSPDSVAKFLTIADHLGVSSLNAASSALRQSSASGLTRIDYTISDRYSLTLRLDARTSSLRTPPASLSVAAGARTQSADAGAFAELASSFGSWANTLRTYFARGDDRSVSPPLPAGSVSLLSSAAGASEADGTLQSVASLQFGGGMYTPGADRQLAELSDQLVRRTASGAQRVMLGATLQRQALDVGAPDAPYGTFAFSSLADLARGIPSSFTRVTKGATGEANRWYTAAYAGDVWRVHTGLQLSFGMRVERDQYGRRPDLSSAVRTLLSPVAEGGPTIADAGVRAQAPPDIALMPRVGFRWDLVSHQHWTVEGGAGAFRGTLSLLPLAEGWDATGARGMSVTCIGSAAPTPTWDEFRVDPSTIPSACANNASSNGAGDAVAFGNQVSSAMLFRDKFGAPRTSRVSLSISGNALPSWGAGASALLVHGTHLSTATDANRALASSFALHDEADRPVYVPASAIDPASGGIGPAASRIDTTLGRVTVFDSRGESWAEQLVLQSTGPLLRGYAAVAYVYDRARLRGSGEPGIGPLPATTSGNPTVFEWSDATFVPRHTFQFLMQTAGARRWRVAAIARLSSGLPFTPLVSGDINGDGLANDRAFVFDPRLTTDSRVAAGMQQLLQSSSSSVRDCLSRQLNHIAAQTSCHTGWSQSLDMSLDVLALGTHASRRLTLTLRASNVTAGLDYALHGPEHLQGWGQPAFPNPVLLVLRGFNQQTHSFRYDVNPQFGRSEIGTLQRAPLTLSIQGRFVVGDDPRYQPLADVIQAALGQDRQGLQRSIAQRLRNIPATILQLAGKDSAALGLSFTQRATLQTQADSLQPAIDDVVDSLAIALSTSGPMSTARRARIAALSERGFSMVNASIVAVRSVLTPAQWGQLPAWLLAVPRAGDFSRPQLQIQLPTDS